METLLIEWQRPVSRGLDIAPVAASMRVHVRTPEDASRVFNALAGILQALTADAPRVRRDNGAPRDQPGHPNLDPRDG